MSWGVMSGIKLAIVPLLSSWLTAVIAMVTSEQDNVMGSDVGHCWFSRMNGARTLKNSPLIYFTLYRIAFTDVEDWARIFFDCFTSLTLWADALYSGIFLVLLLVFTGGSEKYVGRIATECMGLTLQLASVFGYVMLKSARDQNFDQAEARRQNTWALAFYSAFGSAIMSQLHVKIHAPKGQEYWKIALDLAVIGSFLQFLHIGSSVYFRIIENNFEHDELHTWGVKVFVAVIKVITLSYDYWLFTVKGYWISPEKRQIAIMTVSQPHYQLFPGDSMISWPTQAEGSVGLYGGLRRSYQASCQNFHQLGDLKGGAVCSSIGCGEPCCCKLPGRAHKAGRAQKAGVIKDTIWSNDVAIYPYGILIALTGSGRTVLLFSATVTIQHLLC